MPERGRVVTVVAHCHLDVNTRVHGLADTRGVRADVVAPLLEQGNGVVQLPCPEATYLGMDRPGMTREEYDTDDYRQHCRRLLAPVVDTLAALAADGCRIDAVVGVPGSPSCAVADASGGRGSGLLIEELARMLAASGMAVRFR